MVFNPKCINNIVSQQFPSLFFLINAIQYVSQFRYLGHRPIVDNQLSDNEDINRENRNLFMRTNLLLRRFDKMFDPR
jgi:hypothetical protein